MTPEQFVQACKAEKDAMLGTYLDPASESTVGALIAEMQLSDAQKAKLKSVLDTALSETWYTMLLALDGSTSLGDEQQMYELRDEEGNVLSGEGELEAAAWEAFQEDE